MLEVVGLNENAKKVSWERGTEVPQNKPHLILVSLAIGSF